MKIGDRVIVTHRRNHLWGDCCVGKIGTITETFEFNGEQLFKVVAENYGRLMKSAKGKEKKVYAWNPGNHASFYETELKLLV